jgi:hypothetical protein
LQKLSSKIHFSREADSIQGEELFFSMLDCSLRALAVLEYNKLTATILKPETKAKDKDVTDEMEHSLTDKVRAIFSARS